MIHPRPNPLRAILPALLLLTPALPAAEGEPPAATSRKLSAISLLPDGSELKGVMLPRYDENHRLVGVLKAASITLVNEQTIAGETVSIGFSNPDGSPRGHINLARAVFNQIKGILQTSEPVTLQSDRFRATGTGLYYAFQQGEGFLTGPAATWIQPPTETTMNSSHPPLRATLMAGISLITQSLAAAPPPAVKTDELKAAAAPSSQIHSDATRISRTNLRADLDASAATTAKAKAFLEQAELISTTAPGNTPPPAEAKPLDVKPGPKDTLISCDGGMYFDADAGVFVYLKNVKVNDPRFTLSGANELKILLAKKPADATPKPAGKDPQPSLGIGAKFGDVERIIATGAVRILQKQVEPGKQPVEASGAIFSYHPESGEILLSGGYPWVKTGPNFMRAKEPNLTLRIQKSGSFTTEGNWDMGGSLDQSR